MDRRLRGDKVFVKNSLAEVLDMMKEGLEVVNKIKNQLEASEFGELNLREWVTKKFGPIMRMGNQSLNVIENFGRGIHYATVNHIMQLKVIDVRKLESENYLVEFEMEINASFRYTGSASTRIYPGELISCTFELTFDRQTRQVTSYSMAIIERRLKRSSSEPFFCFPHGKGFASRDEYLSHLNQEHNMSPEFFPHVSDTYSPTIFCLNPVSNFRRCFPIDPLLLAGTPTRWLSSIAPPSNP